MLYREIIAVCSEIHTKHINTLCVENVELYAFFCVIPWHLEFICRRFGADCLFHLHRQVDVPMKMEQSVPKRRHINSRRRGVTQNKAYNLHKPR